MEIQERIQRSEVRRTIDLSTIACAEVGEPLQTLEPSERIIIDPIWNNPDDLEGQLYTEYRLDNPEYDAIYLRASVINKLGQACLALDERYSFVVRAGHRPVSVQKALLGVLKQKFVDENPGASDSEALDHARAYVSDPDIKIPPHCCGAAVDLELFDNEKGRLVDFGCPVNTDAEIAHLHTKDIAADQRQNRLLLLNTMLQAEFASNYNEWRHYSYGDQTWAWFYDKNSALYTIKD